MFESFKTTVLYFGGALALGLVFLMLLRLAFRAGRRAMLMKRYNDADIVATIMSGKISRGMTLEMVLDVWGEPADLDETVLKTKTKHELKYDQKGKNRFGTRVYLEDERVVGWETK